MDFLRQQPLTLLERLKNNPQLSPLSSSCGRALDALAACLGSCRDSISYEGQAAMGLETLAATAFATQHGNGYPLAWQPDNALPRLSWQPLWQALLHDMQQAIAPNIIAARIHHGLAAAIADTAQQLAQTLPSDTVVLSGGVFQNRLLLDSVSQRLQQAGLRVLSPRQLPANDGGLAMGQALVAAARSMGST
jgi:hydrogenase maturation protein HypF